MARCFIHSLNESDTINITDRAVWKTRKPIYYLPVTVFPIQAIPHHEEKAHVFDGADGGVS